MKTYQGTVVSKVYSYVTVEVPDGISDADLHVRMCEKAAYVVGEVETDVYDVSEVNDGDV
jgi:hypothetical protein